MNILALDTSAKAAGCAVFSGGTLLGEFFINAGLTHSQTVMPMVQNLLGLAKIPVSEIGVFAVSTGPGSFTGLRIGISAVKGMAMALDKPCAAVSTLEALAYNLCDFKGYIVPVMDARRDQVYAAVFQNDGRKPARMSADEAVSIPDLTARLAAFLPEPVILVGDGAGLCHTAMAEQLPGILIANENARHQRAASVGTVARRMAAENALISAEALAPVYLRLPQAERERLEKGL